VKEYGKMTTDSADGDKAVVVGLSGGVDSAVTAALLQEQGYRVHGVFLCMTRPGGPIQSGPRSCCSPDDARDARRIAEQLGIHFEVRSVSDTMEPIVDHFAATYQAGRTPNPCPQCNATVKFPVLLEEAKRIGAAYVATGHYARTVRGEDGVATLRRAVCHAKDQSYVLYAIGRELLDRLLLPLGEFATKAAVREEAVRLGLEVADKPDSQDICFVPDGGYPELLRSYGEAGLTPGVICDRTGKQLGQHKGYACYTVGQRKGLGVAAGHPVYVTGIDPSTNTVRIGEREELRVEQLEVGEASWLADVDEHFEGEVQVRYGSQPLAAVVASGGGQTRFVVDLPEGAPCAVPGQAAVLYRGDQLLGGGTIDRAWCPEEES
jgi:tRNA-specific 2-thiouridylase